MTVYLEHYLAVNLFRTGHLTWLILGNLAIYTVVCGPFLGLDCIIRAVSVFSFRFYLVFDVLVQQVELAVFAFISLTIPDFRDNLTVRNKIVLP